MIRIECDDCFREYKLKPELAGKRIRCKECGSVISVPAENSRAAGNTAAQTYRQPSGPTQKRPKPKPSGDFDDEDDFNDDYGEDFSPRAPTKLPPITGGRKKKSSGPSEKTRQQKDPQKEESKIYLIAGAITALVIGLPILILFVIGFTNESIAEGVGMTILCIGGIELLLGFGWLNYVIIDEDPVNKFFLRFVPFYAFYFIITRIEETKWILVLWATGIPVIIVALIYLNTQAPGWR